MDTWKIVDMAVAFVLSFPIAYALGPFSNWARALWGIFVLLLLFGVIVHAVYDFVF